MRIRTVPPILRTGVPGLPAQRNGRSEGKAWLALWSDLKMRGYTAGKTKRFKSLNLSEFPSAACVGIFGPPRARGPTRLVASGFHVHLQFHL